MCRDAQVLREAGSREQPGANHVDPPPLLQQDINREAVLFKDALELFQRIHLDLADTLAGHANLLADLFQCRHRVAMQTEAAFNHGTLLLGELRQAVLDI